MTTKVEDPGKKPAEKVLVMRRVIDAPREAVWKAWTNRDQMQRWWGPEGFTNPVCEMNVRPGGAIRIDMRGPDGTVYPMTGFFNEIAEPERLVFTSKAYENEEGDAGFEVHTTLRLAERNGKTELELRVVVVKSTPEMKEALAGMKEGWSQSLVKLAKLLK
jgi:uncharacterized protein YndB with AHSA1/START domain